MAPAALSCGVCIRWVRYNAPGRGKVSRYGSCTWRPGEHDCGHRPYFHAAQSAAVEAEGETFTYPAALLTPDTAGADCPVGKPRKLRRR